MRTLTDEIQWLRSFGARFDADPRLVAEADRYWMARWQTWLASPAILPSMRKLAEQAWSADTREQAS